MRDTNNRPSFGGLLDLIILLVWVIPAFGSIPSGYYDKAAGKSGSALKSALHDIVSDHTKKTYDQAWNLIKETDEDPNNSNNVILIYTGRSQEKEYRDHGYDWDYSQYDGGNGEYNESWNREHVWAKSHGFPSESDTAYTDLHHLRPADRTVNSSRNNKDFDNGGTLHAETSDCYTDEDSWEPRDEVKGDIARMVFYMVVRYDPGYHSDDSPYDLELVDSTGMDLGVAPGRPVLGKLSTLRAWHAADPVDAFEQNRNEVVYSYQGNRNPFIDHPEYVDSLWNDALPAPSNLAASNISETGLTLTWSDNASDESGFYVYKNDSKINTLSADATNLSVSGLTSGTTYTFKVSAYRTAEESSKASLDVTTGGRGNLIITGVYDGPLTGGIPKGVELYVINDIADMTAYGLGSANNGEGSDGEEFSFPAGSATAGDYIYVSSEDPGFSSFFGQSPDHTSGSMAINGDDAIELFYDSTVIDVFGDINVDGSGQSWDYLDGWAYSKANRGVSTTFNTDHWTFSGINALDGETTNAAAATPFPAGTFSYTDGSLPVELSTWNASSKHGEVILTWQTESEIDNQGFVIERALRQAQGPDPAWSSIASFLTYPELRGQGSTTGKTEYRFVDKAVKVGERYTYRLSDVDYRGNRTTHPTVTVTVTDFDMNLKPSAVTLYPAYPNPFNPEVTLSFNLEQDDHVSISIYDINGNWITDLISQQMETGSHSLVWKGTSQSGMPAPSGVYLVQLSTKLETHIQRITLLR